MKIRKVIYEEINIDRARLITLSEAARQLGMTLQGVSHAIDRGELAEIIDEHAPYQGRRLVELSEVAVYAERRALGIKNKPRSHAQNVT